MSKLILITGVSQGLGREMATQFVKRGHRVVGCARNKAAIATLQEQLRPKGNFVGLDITDELGVKAWSQGVLSKIGIPDLLINSAGISHMLAPLWTIEGAVFNRIIDVNVKGTANIIRHFVPAMVDRQQGVIVNFSAGWGRYTTANAAPYCASKWAIEGMTKALSQELPAGMAAVTLWPGTIHTEALVVVYGKEKAANYMSPEKWGEVAVPFLLHIGASDNGKPLSIPTG